MPEQTERFLTTIQIGLIFKVDPKTVSRWASTGRITSRKTPGGRHRFLESDVRALMTEMGISGDRADALLAAV